jgi:electron transfer DM13
MFHRIAMFAAALTCTLAAGSLAAQQDSGMMSHDSAMMDHGTMDHGSMDSGSMDHDDANMMFMGAPGQKAGGDYAVADADGKRQITLTGDFAVASAPDLWLVLANGDTPDKDALWVGRLKQATGAQTYDLPKGKDVSGYETLLVWSKKEKRAVASAKWHAPTHGTMEHM